MHRSDAPPGCQATGDAGRDAVATAEQAGRPSAQGARAPASSCAAGTPARPAAGAGRSVGVEPRLHREAVRDRGDEFRQTREQLVALVRGTPVEAEPPEVLLVPPPVEREQTRAQLGLAEGVREDVEEPAERVGADDHAAQADHGGVQTLVLGDLADRGIEPQALVMDQGVGDGADEAGLVAEVVADRGLVDARGGGDVLEGHRLVAALGEQPRGGIEDLARRLGQGRQRVAEGDLHSPLAVHSATRIAPRRKYPPGWWLPGSLYAVSPAQTRGNGDCRAARPGAPPSGVRGDGAPHGGDRFIHAGVVHVEVRHEAHGPRRFVERQQPVLPRP